MTLPNRWISQLGALTGLLAGALLLGWWFGGAGWWVTGALAIYVGYTLRHLYALDRVLDGHKRVPLFETRGFWAEVLARVDKLRAKARSRKKKYHRLLREVRESTGALSDGGIILNADREIVWFNPAAARLLGLKAATDIGNRIDFYRTMAPGVKQHGRLAIIDYAPGAPRTPHPNEEHVPRSQVISEAEDAGFKFVKDFQFLTNQYFLVFEKQ